MSSHDVSVQPSGTGQSVVQGGAELRRFRVSVGTDPVGRVYTAYVQAANELHAVELAASALRRNYPELKDK